MPENQKPDNHTEPSDNLPEPTSNRPRHNGWTKPKMRAFLEALAASGSITAAAKSVHMSRDSAYKLRARLAGTPFDLAWEAALENALRQVAHEAIDRAINGVAHPIFHKGEQVGEKRVFNESLTRFILDNPSRLGRTAVAREYALSQWDGILDRVEQGDIDWNERERTEAGSEEDVAATEFIAKRSDYARGWMWEISQKEHRAGHGKNSNGKNSKR